MAQGSRARVGVLKFRVGSVNMVNGGNRDVYMDAGTVLMVSVGADTMGAPRVTTVAGVVVGAGCNTGQPVATRGAF
jgi:hypothetical protein